MRIPFEMEESFFFRTAIAGDSLLEITSVAFTTSILSPFQFRACRHSLMRSSRPMMETVPEISFAA